MNTVLRNALALAGVVIATQTAAEVTFYQGEGFEGRSFTTASQIRNFDRVGFNDSASSVVVLRDRWEVCEEAQFNGRCVVLRPGRYPSLGELGLNDGVSSVRTVSRNARIDSNRYAPVPAAAYDYQGRNDRPAPVAARGYQRRDGERLYEANVTSVRAVVGPPEQRCWVEHQPGAQDRGNANVPAAIAGAVIGGILGHQVGGGHGQDLATAGGAVAGAFMGSNIGRGGNEQQAYGQDVQRCSSTPSQSRPEYWDVTYDFQGREHRVQMAAPPGPTVTVNDQGEPRA